MLEQSTGKEDFSSTLISETKSGMPWRVKEVTPLDDYRLAVRFFDGTTGRVNLSGLIQSPRAGVFARLADPTVFNQVFVDHGAVAWPGELDLAPDAMYTEIKKTGEWVLA